jgi:hypothetical protein
VPQDEPPQDEQFLLAPPPPIAGDDECTANAEKSRRTSPEEHEGQTGLVPLRTSSSNAAWHWLQENS